MATAHRLSFHPLARQARAALKWLQRTMGFEVSDLLVDSRDQVMHAQMIPGQRTVMMGSAWADWTASPLSLSGKNSQGSASRSTAGSMSTATKHAARGLRSSRSQPSWSTAFAPAWRWTWRGTSGPFGQTVLRGGDGAGDGFQPRVQLSHGSPHP